MKLVSGPHMVILMLSLASIQVTGYWNNNQFSSLVSSPSSGGCRTSEYTYNPKKNNCKYKYECKNVCQTVNKQQCTSKPSSQPSCTTYKKKQCSVIKQESCSSRNRIKRSFQEKAHRRRHKRTIGAIIQAKKNFFRQVFGIKKQKKRPLSTNNYYPSNQQQLPSHPTQPPSSSPWSPATQNVVQNPQCQTKNKYVCKYVPYKEVCINRPVKQCTTRPTTECKKKCQNRWICTDCNSSAVTIGPPAPPTGSIISKPTVRPKPTIRPTFKPGPPAPPTGGIITRPTLRPKPTVRPTFKPGPPAPPTGTVISKPTLKPLGPTIGPPAPPTGPIVSKPGTRPKPTKRPKPKPTVRPKPKPTVRPKPKPTSKPGPPAPPTGPIILKPTVRPKPTIRPFSTTTRRPGPPAPPTNFVVRPPSIKTPVSNGNVFQVIEVRDQKVKTRRRRVRKRRKKKKNSNKTLVKRRGKRDEEKVKLPVGPPQ